MHFKSPQEAQEIFDPIFQTKILLEAYIQSENNINKKSYFRYCSFFIWIFTSRLPCPIKSLNILTLLDYFTATEHAVSSEPFPEVAPWKKAQIWNWTRQKIIGLKFSEVSLMPQVTSVLEYSWTNLLPESSFRRWMPVARKFIFCSSLLRYLWPSASDIFLKTAAIYSSLGKFYWSSKCHSFCRISLTDCWPAAIISNMFY